LQGKHLTVTKDAVGLLKKSSSKLGISGTASGNTRLKNSLTVFLSVSAANDSLPSNGKNKVQVKLPSILGRAIIIYVPRAHICKQFFSIAKPPSLVGGICNSLYP